MIRSRLQLTQSGWAITVAVVVLLGFGLATIYVTDTPYSSGHDGPLHAAKQTVRVLLGLLVGVVILQIGYQRICRYAYEIFFLTLVLLIPLLIAKLSGTSLGGLTAPRHGAYRWLHLPGFPVQPSELMKVAYVLALARYLRHRKDHRRPGGLLIPILLSLVPLGLILLEPDLGTALLILPVLLSMLLLAGARPRHLATVTLIGLAFVPLAWGMLHGYQRARVAAVLLQSDRLRQAVIDRPEAYRFLATKREAIEWASDSGFQLVHSKNAIGSGGVLGHGWGAGPYISTPLLPDRHNDFVFALIGHQWGLAGCLIVLGCYVLIVLAGTRIASATAEPVGRLLAVGVVAIIGTQAIINIAMTIGLMPITGLTLPFVSYGGSSLLISFVSVALLMAVSRDRPYLLAEKPFDFASEEDEGRTHFLELQDESSDGRRCHIRSAVR